MNLYRVDFIDKKPAKSTLLDAPDYKDVRKFDTLNTDGSIKWLPVFGIDTEDSLDIANRMIKDFFGSDGRA